MNEQTNEVVAEDVAGACAPQAEAVPAEGEDIPEFLKRKNVEETKPVSDPTKEAAPF